MCVEYVPSRVVVALITVIIVRIHIRFVLATRFCYNKSILNFLKGRSACSAVTVGHRYLLMRSCKQIRCRGTLEQGARSKLFQTLSKNYASIGWGLEQRQSCSKTVASGTRFR